MGTIFIPEDYGYFNTIGNNQQVLIISTKWHPSWNSTRIDVLTKDNIFIKGDKVNVISNGVTFAGKITQIWVSSTNYTVLGLDKGIDYTNGEVLRIGTISKVMPETIPSVASVAETVTKNGSKNLIWIGLVAIGAYFLFFNKKGKKSK